MVFSKDKDVQKQGMACGWTHHAGSAASTCGHGRTFQESVQSGIFMQNRCVPKFPFSSKAPASKAALPQPASAPELFPDPLPVPDATESNTDTVWGLWEHSLQSDGDAELATQAADLHDFPETVISELTPLQAKKP
jgi:hypothetical protein